MPYQALVLACQLKMMLYTSQVSNDLGPMSLASFLKHLEATTHTHTEFALNKAKSLRHQLSSVMLKTAASEICKKMLVST